MVQFASNNHSLRPRLSVLYLEDRTVPTVAFAAGSGPGVLATVKVYDEDGALLREFNPYPGFTGGVRVAVALLNDDFDAEVITAPGPGFAPVVRVFDGISFLQANTRPLRDFFAYAEDFTGGVFVAAGDLDGDGFGEITTGPDVGGGPHVQAFDFATGATVLSFLAYAENFTGGVRVASSDVDGDNGGTAGNTGDQEIICAAGPGGGPHITVWDYDDQLTNPNRFGSFFAYDQGFTSGVFVGGGRITNNFDDQNFAHSDIVTGPGDGGGPILRVWSVDDISDPANFTFVMAREANIFGDIRSGVRVAAVLDLDFDGRDDMIASTGPGVAPNAVTLFTTDAPLPPTPDDLGQIGVILPFETFDPAFLGGVYVNG